GADRPRPVDRLPLFRYHDRSPVPRCAGPRQAGSLPWRNETPAPGVLLETASVFGDQGRQRKKLNFGAPGSSIKSMIIDLQHDSPVPLPEQLACQLMAQVALGGLKAGEPLADYRELAQQLLTNPQVVAKAYADLEWEGVLQKAPTGAMKVAAGAEIICKVRLQDP